METKAKTANTYEELSEYGCVNLLYGIVYQAALDYRKCVDGIKKCKSILKKNPRDPEARYNLDYYERDFAEVSGFFDRWSCPLVDSIYTELKKEATAN